MLTIKKSKKLFLCDGLIDEGFEWIQYFESQPFSVLAILWGAERWYVLVLTGGLSHSLPPHPSTEKPAQTQALVDNDILLLD